MLPMHHRDLLLAFFLYSLCSVVCYIQEGDIAAYQLILLQLFHAVLSASDNLESRLQDNASTLLMVGALHAIESAATSVKNAIEEGCAITTDYSNTINEQLLAATELTHQLLQSDFRQLNTPRRVGRGQHRCAYKHQLHQIHLRYVMYLQAKSSMYPST